MGAVEEVESVEKADTRQPKVANNKWQRSYLLEKTAVGNESPLTAFFGKCIASVRSQVGSDAPPSYLAKGMFYGIQRLRLYSESRGAE
jgi:hypothetical protein